MLGIWFVAQCVVVKPEAVKSDYSVSVGITSAPINFDPDTGNKKSRFATANPIKSAAAIVTDREELVKDLVCP